MNTKWLRNGFIYLLIVVAVIAIFYTLFPSVGGSDEKSISEVIAMAKQRQIDTIEIRGDKLTAYTTRGEAYTSRKEGGASLLELLTDAGVDPYGSNPTVIVKGSSGLGSLFSILLNFLPLIFFGAVLLFIMRQAQGAKRIPTCT
jgi:cell division protease FtsH